MIRSFPSHLPDLYRIITHAAFAVVVSHLHKVLTGSEIGSNARVRADAAVVVFSDERRGAARSEEFHDNIGRPPCVDDVATIGRCGELVEVFLAHLADRGLGAQPCVDLEFSRIGNGRHPSWGTSWRRR